MPLVTVLFNWGLSKLSSHIDPKEVGPGFIIASEASDMKGAMKEIVNHVKTTNLLINDECDAKLICDVYVTFDHSRVLDLGNDLSYLLEINNRQGSQRFAVKITENHNPRTQLGIDIMCQILRSL